MKRIQWYIISALAVLSSAMAQDSLALYHPLSKGNVWIYSEFRWGLTPHFIQREVLGDSLIGSKYYQVLLQTNSMNSTVSRSIVRFDTTTGCYYSRAGGTDFLEDSTSASTPNTRFGEFPNTLAFVHFDTGAVLGTQTTTRAVSDGIDTREQVTTWEYSFGFGLIFETELDYLHSGEPIYTLNLLYAEIDGKKYGTKPPMPWVSLDSLAQYHPLSKGNLWIYRVLRPPSDTLYERYRVLGDSLIDDKYYQILSETWSKSSTVSYSLVRFDTTTGCYYSRSSSNDILEDSTLTFTPRTSFGGGSNNRVFVRLDTGSVLESATTTRVITEGALIKEDQVSWSYSYGLGLIYETDIDLMGLLPQWTLQLVYTKIDGREYGTIPLSVRATTQIIPTSFFLSQNYPNPFNPSTIINYQLAMTSFVTLKVFDVLGREVATLVNEGRPAGACRVEWNATNFSSGVYFYRLQVGSFVNVKKLLLLR